MVLLNLLLWLQVSWHIFDFIIVILSLLDLCLANLKGLSLLRSVRLVSMMMTSPPSSVLNKYVFPS